MRGRVSRGYSACVREIMILMWGSITRCLASSGACFEYSTERKVHTRRIRLCNLSYICRALEGSCPEVLSVILLCVLYHTLFCIRVSIVSLLN